MSTNVYSFRAKLPTGITGTGYVKTLENNNAALLIGLFTMGLALFTSICIGVAIVNKTKTLVGSGINSHKA